MPRKQISTAGKSQPPPSDDNVLNLIAYCVRPERIMKIVPAPRARDWMDKTDDHAANRCLPLLIGNQNGWLLLSRERVEATWSGSDEPEAISIKSSTPGYSAASSHFGYGILTWNIPFLFRTPPGYNLLVRGPANEPKDGIFPLDGVVETDWAEAVFTMNWKFTRANHTVVFEKDEPVCMVAPQLRGELEKFRPVVRSIESAPDEREGVFAWSASREQFIADMHSGDGAARAEGWQKHYTRGLTVRGTKAPAHQIKLNLADFVVEMNEPAMQQNTVDGNVKYAATVYGEDDLAEPYVIVESTSTLNRRG